MHHPALLLTSLKFPSSALCLLAACSLVLKAMQDPEYARFLDDAIYEERRRGFPEGARCVVWGGCCAADCGGCFVIASVPAQGCFDFLN